MADGNTAPKFHDAGGGAGGAPQAIREWTEALGTEAVKADEATLERYGRTTQSDAPAPSCVLYPSKTADVQSIVSIASRHGVVVYPISCGKNWGYGDACAPTDGSAIVDLGRMNEILEVNTTLAYCVIEPGVTQGQLYDYLQKNDTGLWMDATAAGPDASLVGNTLDRGFGHTRYGDHFLSCCGMEVVLADGRVLNTGFGHFGNAKAERVYPYGVGPYLDGIFGQSNFGIVTKIGLWLLPEPEDFTFFFFQGAELEDLGPIVDRLRPLRLSGVLQTPIHIGNDFRVLAGSGRRAWEEAPGETPLSHGSRMRLRRETSAMSWQGTGSITGTRGHVRAGRKALRRALRGLTKVYFVTDRRLALAEGVVKTLNKVGLAKVMAQRLAVLRPNFELLKGVPVEEPVLGAQWRLRNDPGPGVGDPLERGCGLYWISPVMPMVGDEALALLRLVQPIFDRHGFDVIVSFVLLTERSLVAIFNVAFDKSVKGEPEQASACYEELVDAMMAEGYVLYRCGLQGMSKIHRGPSVFWDVARQLKETLDPNDIIARGRYIAPLKEPPTGP